LAVTAFSAKAQDGGIAAGHAFAREAYKACHQVEAEEASREYPDRAGLSRYREYLEGDGDGPG
jgi:hypothetical protein